MSVWHCLPSVILLAICVCVFFLQISQVSLCYYLEQSIVCHLIGHLCVCVCVCMCVFKISQVSLCYYLEKNAEHYIVCHLLSYWPERPLQRPSISNLIGRHSTAVRPYLLFLDNFFGFVNNFFLKIFCLFLNISIKIQTQIQIQKQSDWQADQSDHICYFCLDFLNQ